MCQLGNDIRQVQISPDDPRIGWRWMIMEADGLLRPPFMHSYAHCWTQEVAASSLPPTIYQPGGPGEDSDYTGLHCFSNLAECILQKPNFNRRFNAGRLEVLAQVIYWGQTVEAQHGARAEFAKVLKLRTSMQNFRKFRQANPNLPDVKRISPVLHMLMMLLKPKEHRET
jgi:hypothetical protein